MHIARPAPLLPGSMGTGVVPNTGACSPLQRFGKDRQLDGFVSGKTLESVSVMITMNRGSLLSCSESRRQCTLKFRLDATSLKLEEIGNHPRDDPLGSERRTTADSAFHNGRKRALDLHYISIHGRSPSPPFHTLPTNTQHSPSPCIYPDLDSVQPGHMHCKDFHKAR
jgi:hypothetical protein